MSSAAGWKPLLLFATTGLLLSILPANWSDTIRSAVNDAARPGQLAALAAAKRVRGWHNAGPADVERGLGDELAAARLELRRMRLVTGRMQDQLDAANADTTGYSPPLPPPLLIEHLVSARVLGEETTAVFQASRLLDLGRHEGVTADDLVLEPGRPLLDQGRDAGLVSGQPVYAGRRVVGRIGRVGKWTSTVQSITDPRFRGLARLARPGRDAAVFTARGLLQGTGESECRLTLIRGDLAVQVGDEVYTAGRDGQPEWPMFYGTVVAAQLKPGASHWEILVRPAVSDDRLEQVEVFTRKLNPARFGSTGATFQ